MNSILIIEDDIEQLDSLRDVLGVAGYATMCAQNGREALDLLRDSEPPAIILLDLTVMNGRQFLARKRNHPALVKVPVVAMSGTTTERPQGAVAFMRKPIIAANLLKLINGYC